jgi:hypothetical protein
VTSGSFRVKIPRTPGAPVNAGLEPTPTEEHPTDLPGTFITAIPPLGEASLKEL